MLLRKRGTVTVKLGINEIKAFEVNVSEGYTKTTKYCRHREAQAG